MPRITGLYTIRRVAARDLQSILEIEQQSFSPTWDADRIARSAVSELVNCVVAESNERVIGCLWYANRVHGYDLVRLGVLENARRKGVATRLVEHLRRRLVGKKHRIETHLHERALSGQLFLRSAGFMCERIIRNGSAVGGETADTYVFGLEAIRR